MFKKSLVIVSALLCVQPVRCDAQVTLRVLDGPSVLNAVSTDGRVAVGARYFLNAAGASAWDPTNGAYLQSFGHIYDRSFAFAYGVTSNASFASGFSGYDPVLDAAGSMRWTVAPNMGPTLVLPRGGAFNGSGDGGYGISADGTVIVGQSAGRAVVWSGGGVQTIGPASNLARATAITPDGARGVGFAMTGPGSTFDAFTWTSPSSPAPLPHITPDSTSSMALALSGNGRTMVGFSGTPSGMHLTRWTLDSSDVPHAEDLAAGTLPVEGFQTRAAISADGSVIGGVARFGLDPDAPSEAAIYTSATGLISLSDLLVQNGIALPVRLADIAGISGDGRTIVGNLYFTTGGTEYPGVGYIVTIPAPGAASLAAGIMLANVARRRRNGGRYNTAASARAARAVGRRVPREG